MIAHLMHRLRRAAHCARLPALAALVLALAGCAIPDERVERNARSMEPRAVAAAEERAQTDLACSSLASKVVAREIPQSQTAYSLQRSVFSIETQGCRRKIRYAVACIPDGTCSAMAETGLVEKVQ